MRNTETCPSVVGNRSGCFHASSRVHDGKRYKCDLEEENKEDAPDGN